MSCTVVAADICHQCSLPSLVVAVVFRRHCRLSTWLSLLVVAVVVSHYNKQPLPTFIALINQLIPKKVELLIRFFEPFWISRVFHFSLGTFGKVEAHPGPLEPSDETYTLSKFDISGSNETMQNALASIV